jgi:curved DNA-binding protein CbpA
MTPYEILGVTPTTSLTEIEARYRLLLREYHPDLHQDEGPEAIAYCEAMTRSINSAMARVRVVSEPGSGRTAWSDRSQAGPAQSRSTGDAGATREGDGDARWHDPPSYSQWFGENPFYRPPGDRPDASADEQFVRGWFGEPIEHPDDEPVPCPLCGQPFDQLAEYEWHLRRDHKFKDASTAPPKPRSPYSPVRIIGALRFIPAWFVALCGFALWGTVGFHAFVGAMVFLCLVMWTQQSAIFKRR